jgi:hypothetical protein
LQRNAELEHSTRNAREQAERQARQLEKYQKAEKDAEAAKKAAEDAQLGEIERVKKQHAEAEARISQYKQQLVLSKVREAARDKGIIDPEMAALALMNKLEYDDEGMPANLDKALDTLIKNKPYLVPTPPTAPATPTPAASTPNTPSAPTLPAMSPGRSSIASPNALPPGKTTLTDIKWSR